jgi:hypothetical protein
MRYINLSVQQSDIKIKKELNFNEVPLTCGSVNDIACRFAFSKEWNSYPIKVAVFSGSGKSITVAITDDIAIIPWECLADEGGELSLGVVGLCDLPDTNSYKQLNTEYVSLGIIMSGASIASDNTDNAPTPDLAEQLLLAVNDVMSSEAERKEGYADMKKRLTEAENNVNALSEQTKIALDSHLQSEIMSEDGSHNFRIKNKLLEFFDGKDWRNVELERNYKIMSVLISLSNYQPEQMLTYSDDAKDLTPGSAEWDNFFGHYPVLLKNGKEVGKLDPTDFSKFEDGTPISVDNGETNDVCIAFPRRGIRIERKSAYIKLSMTDHPDLFGFEYNAHRYNNIHKNIFYVGAYLSSLTENADGKTVMSSLSNKPVSIINTLSTAQEYAHNKNALLFSYYQWLFIQCMYLLKYKNLDSQRAVCSGFIGSGTSVDNLATGISDAYGMDSALLTKEERASGNYRSKLLGLEDIYGTVYQWLDCIFTSQSYIHVYWAGNYVDGIAKIDGSFYKGYASDIMATTRAGFLPAAFTGSNSTYYTDWTVLYPSSYCIVGGSNTGGYGAGIFCLRLGEQPDEENKTFDKAARIMYL